MTALETKAYNILNLLYEASLESEYGGYVGYEQTVNIICSALFGHPAVGRTYNRNDHHHYPKTIATKEEFSKVMEVIKRMSDQKLVVISKSKSMLKPLVSADEWYSKRQK